MPRVIEIKGLTKAYGKNVALRDVDLTIGPREVVGLIGPNGAGKTTLIKLICSLLRPTRGTIAVNGRDVTKDVGYKARMAYMAENAGYYESMTAFEYLNRFGYLHSVADVRGRSKECLREVGLYEHGDERISTFSKGMKQRLGIARCLLNDPELVIMDEPLTALDPNGKTDVIDLITRMRDRGATVILSSHELRYMDDLCDRLCILKNGELVENGTPESIVHKAGSLSHYKVLLKRPLTNEDILRAQFPEIVELSCLNNLLHLEVDGGADFEKRFLRFLLDNDIEFTVQSHQLDRIYSDYFREAEE
jgi:ABC-2 type transport system ATP-binding protein